MDITVKELIERGRKRLQEAGVDSPEFDAKVLCAFLFGLSLSELPVHYRESLADIKDLMSEHGGSRHEDLEAEFEVLTGRRAAREPLQYITKEQDFMGLVFKTDERGLIPRLDTEILTSETLDELVSVAATKGPPEIKVLDMCCGTGAIGLSLARLWKDAGPDQGDTKLGVSLSDISGDVLGLARENAEGLGVLDEVDLIESDLFSGITDDDFDIVVSNPPYIPTEVISDLQEEVRGFEPMAALDGGKDGLDFYRRIIKEAPGHLKEGGFLLLEIGSDQRKAVTELISSDGRYLDIGVRQDLAGLDRVVRATRV